MTTKLRKPPRASFENTLEFCNKVREALGGTGATIDALMPAIPNDPNQCLIAKNLNFNCRVHCEDYQWQMHFDTEEQAVAVRRALGLAKGAGERSVVLPKTIGQVAKEFDAVWEDVGSEIDGAWQEWHFEKLNGEFTETFKEFVQNYYSLSKRQLDLLKEWWPYIDASISEAAANGALNERGELSL